MLSGSIMLQNTSKHYGSKEILGMEPKDHGNSEIRV